MLHFYAMNCIFFSTLLRQKLQQNTPMLRSVCKCFRLWTNAIGTERDLDLNWGKQVAVNRTGDSVGTRSHIGSSRSLLRRGRGHLLDVQRRAEDEKRKKGKSKKMTNGSCGKLWD